MDLPIEVRYAGVAVGRATQLRDWSSTGAFIGFAEPLPAGTRIELRGEGVRQPARVEDVMESADAALAGMRVHFLSEAAAAEPPRAEAQAAAPAPKAPAAVQGDAAAVDPASAGDAAGETGDGGAGAGGGKRRRKRR